MGTEIVNGGSGPKIAAHVDDNNQLHNFSIATSEVQDAVAKGNAYNINTGWMTLTTANASAVFFFKNNEEPVNGESAFIIDTLIVGIEGLGTIATGTMASIVLIKNGTAGTIVSNATAVDYNSNRNFGSNKTLSTSLIYKGTEGYTLTGGTSVALIGQSPATRVAYPIDIELEKGSSFGVTIDTETSSGNTRVYVAIVGHRKDGKNK